MPGLRPIRRLPRRGLRFAERVLEGKAAAVRSAARARAVAVRRRLRWLGPRRARVARFEARRDTAAAARYAAALDASAAAARVVIAVPGDPDSREGVAAVGLGQHLARLGDSVGYLGPGEWTAAPASAETYVSLVPQLDPVELPPACLLVGWVLDEQAWVTLPTLGLFDLLACASLEARSAIERVFSGATLFLPEAVDEELFKPRDASARAGAVVVWEAGPPPDVGEPGVPFAVYAPLQDVPAGLAAHAVGVVDAFERPALYGQAALVLAPSPVGVLEALAAGALPLAADTEPLHALGLERVPRYLDGDELAVLAQRYLGDEAARSQLVEGLAAVVAERHTYRQRAQVLRAALARLGPRTARLVVGFWPDYRATNPYQRLLYSAAPEHDALAVPAANPVALAGRCAQRGEEFVYHLHWTSTILGPARTEQVAELRLKAFLVDIDRILDRGGRLVWTVHNVLPHEARYPSVEVRLVQGIAERAAMIHVMCAETLAAVAEHYDLPEDRVHVVEHPGYVDVYPNLVDPLRARAELGLEPDHTVLLALGTIRAYKGLDDLLDAFEGVSAEHPHYRLVIAGRPDRWEGAPALARRCAANPRVVAHFEAVADADLQRYFNASDVVVLPHRSVLNSGALLLALSFARPVIAPSTGCLAALLTDDIGVGFSAEGRDLAAALAQAERLKAPRYRRAAFATAQRYDHRAISARLISLIGRPTGPG